MLKIAQYPRNADNSPMNTIVGVLTDATGNGGARLVTPPVGPDGAPIDAVALVLVDQGGVPIILGSGINGYSTRTTMAGAASPTVGQTIQLGEPGREGIFFVANASAWTAAIAADTQQAVFVASTVDATKVYVRLEALRRWLLDVRWFGAVLDDVTDDHVAILAARDLSFAMALNPGANPFYKSGPTVFIPGTAYIGANSYDMKHTHELLGINTSGLQGFNYPSHLRNTGVNDVVICQRYDTSGVGTVDGVTHFGSDGSTIRKIRLRGDYTNTEGEAHGIHAKCRIGIDDVYISDCRGDGIYVHADAVSGGADHGNANLGWIRNSSAVNCRDGRSFAGGDSNVWLIENFDGSTNRRWRDNDNSFLNTVEIGGHGADNGLVVGAIPTICSNGGNRYTPVNGQAAAASVTAPSGTADTAVWLWVQAGGVAPSLNIPAWTNAMSIREGGGGLLVNANSRKLYLAPYREGGQAPIQAYGPNRIVSPQADVRGTSAIERVTSSGVPYQRRLAVLDSPGTNGITLGNGIDDFYLQIADTLGNSITMIPFGGNFALGVFGSGPTFFELTGETTTRNIGKRKLNFPDYFGLADKKMIGGMTAAPTTGTYVQGDYVKNAAPTVGQPKGWYCTVGGTPGTWVSEGNL